MTKFSIKNEFLKFMIKMEFELNSPEIFFPSTIPFPKKLDYDLVCYVLDAADEEFWHKYIQLEIFFEPKILDLFNFIPIHINKKLSPTLFNYILELFWTKFGTINLKYVGNWSRDRCALYVNKYRIMNYDIDMMKNLHKYGFRRVSNLPRDKYDWELIVA